MKPIFKLISIVFHPLFILMYMLGLTMLINPYIFQLTGHKAKGLLFIAIFFTSVLLPLVGILMMRFLGFMSTLQMKNPLERIGPFIITGVCYIWLYLNIRENNTVPLAYNMFVLGATISLFIAFFVNNFDKVSLHAAGMSGMLMGFFIISILFGQGVILLNLGFIGKYQVQLVFISLLLILLTGLVCTSRLYLQAHDLREVAGGLIIGILGQVIALRIIF